MIKSNKFAFLIVGLFAVTLVFTGCSTTGTNTSNGNSVVTNGNAANTAKPANTEATKTETASGAKIGVPECDEYVEKYEACLDSIAAKYPQVQPSLKSAYEAQRDAFKKAAANPQSKATLPATCKQAIETAKQSTSAYACKW
jgi:hypothetical protein